MRAADQAWDRCWKKMVHSRETAPNEHRRCALFAVRLPSPPNMPLREAPSLETFVMAAISVCVGAFCATRFKVLLIVLASVVLLVTSIIVATFSDSWTGFAQI